MMKDQPMFQAVIANIAALTAGIETRTVEMMPMRAYASAQKGSASGSLQAGIQLVDISLSRLSATII